MSSSALEKQVALNYPAKLYFDEEDSLFVIEFPDLPGCHAHGATPDEAYKNAQGAKREWIRVCIEQGFPIPKPAAPAEHSGRLLLRLPPTLHSMLSDRAKSEGVSLNKYVVHLLSSGVTSDQASERLKSLQDEIRGLQIRLSTLARLVKDLAAGSIQRRPALLFLSNESLGQNVDVRLADQCLTDSPGTFIVSDSEPILQSWQLAKDKETALSRR